MPDYQIFTKLEAIFDKNITQTKILSPKLFF
jgi:hypothetical protein